MRQKFGKAARVAGAAAIAAGLASLWSIGCGFDIGSSYLFGGVNPFDTGSPDGSGGSGGGTGGDGGFFDGGAGGAVDPCDESLQRKFVRVSMRNQAEDFIHYFVAFIAFENGEVYPDGSACAEDADLYTSFGYQRIAEGAASAFGNYCIEGPAFVYFHQAGRFRGGGSAGSETLASAIAPAQGSAPSFDAFFTSSGAQVPVPNVILFHNPGTGDGAQLSTRRFPNPCETNIITPIFDDCNLDSFYYVDQDDQIAGSNALGSGAGRRVPTEVQGTSCECGALVQDFQAGQILASGTLRASDVPCNSFMRGGRVEYAFVRDDTTPAFPQLVWRVSDASGGQVHDFDSRANIP